MTDIERITDMEQCFDRVDGALRALEEAVDTITSLEDDILKLDAYYSGDEWKTDFRSDELGLLPQDLKRGVLSEDAIWNLLGRVDGVKAPHARFRHDRSRIIVARSRRKEGKCNIE